MRAETAVLFITETSDLTADLLVLAAKSRGISFVRFNQDEFPRRTCIEWETGGRIRFCCEGQSFQETEIAGAWFRKKPVIQTRNDYSAAFVLRESGGFLEGVWETTPWFWMNSPFAIAHAEHKLLQLRYAQSVELAVPDTLATNCPDAARDFVRSGPRIAKAVVGGAVDVDGAAHAVFTTRVTPAYMRSDDALRASPVIFQSRIHTQFDLRIFVVGHQVFAARIIIKDRTEEDVDWRKANPDRLRYENHTPPAELVTKCITLMSAMGLNYGALDFIVTPEGEHIFLEINPSGQWGWIERALGLPITNTIIDRLLEGTP